MTPRTCEQCGAAMAGRLRPGPSRRYCTARCRKAASRARQVVPEYLRMSARWVMWKLVTRGGLPTKMPIQPTGAPASSTDRATWSPWSRVKPAARKGFVLGEGIGCIDLDHCLIDGEPTDAAAAFLATLPPTYIEVSPSGDGLHVWGRIPAGRGRRYRTDDGLRVERYSTGRYITVTERPWRGSVCRLADLSDVS
ncbi:bifunctional DNA primase/polymerase [Nocardia farcinica]|uniref:bifunctional DNA primase/polymerase n=1 Tax=Nocardia farcinica TaxID=37329 RepID=UPI001E2C34F2|nr:bifunctional DNA primase/polymerase [Nocardia farcinica]